MGPVTYEVAIPSYNREETLPRKTLRMLRDGGIGLERVTLFVHGDDQAFSYQQSLSANGMSVGSIVPVPVLGLPNMRNAMATHWPDGTQVVSLDDDLSGVFAKLDDKHLLPVDDLDSLFREAFSLASQTHLGLWGTYPVSPPNPLFMKHQARTDLRFVIAHLFGFITTHEPHALVDVPVKEDYQRTLRWYCHDGGVLRLDWIAAKTRFRQEPGGQQGRRTREANRAACYALRDEFPDLVTLNTNKLKRTGWLELRLKDRRRVAS